MMGGVNRGGAADHRERKRDLPEWILPLFMAILTLAGFGEVLAAGGGLPAAGIRLPLATIALNNYYGDGGGRGGRRK
jgi:hypothetical protein